MRFKLLFLILITVFILSLPTFGQEVRVVYFYPTDRIPGDLPYPNKDEVKNKLNILTKTVRNFYQQEMKKYGFHDKIFDFEDQDGDGYADVKFLMGNHVNKHYRGNGTQETIDTNEVITEIETAYGDMSKFIYLIFANIGREPDEIPTDGENVPNTICGLGKHFVGNYLEKWIRNGKAWAIVRYADDCSEDLLQWVTKHELGHAFGLDHDFRSDDYIMAYSPSATKLSQCAAEWLSVCKPFNDYGLSELLPSMGIGIDWESIDEASATELRFRFEISNLNFPVPFRAPHQAQLLMIQKEVPKGFYPGIMNRQEEWDKIKPKNKLALCDCEKIENSLGETVEFIYNLEEKGGFEDAIELRVIDKKGNITFRNFTLVATNTSEAGSQNVDQTQKIDEPATPSDTNDFSQESRLRATLNGHTDFVSSIAFSHNGSRLVSSSWDNSIRLWDTNTLETLAEGWHSHDVTSVTFSPDGLRIASGGRDEVIRIWNSNAKAMGSTYTSDYLGAFTSVVFIHYPDTDYYRVAAANELDGGIDYFNYYDGSTRFSSSWYPIGTHSTSSLAVSPNQRMIASGGAKLDTNVVLWDPYNKKSLKTLMGHTDFITSVAFSPDSRTLASGSWDNTIRLWNIADGKPILTLIGHTDRVLSVAFSPDGKTLASGSDDHTIRLWDVATGQQKDTLLGHTSGVTSLAFNPNRITYMLASAGGWDNTVRLWDLSPAPIPAPTVKISPSPIVSPDVGDNLTVKINISGVQNVAGWQATVHFDPTALRYVKSANGTYLPTGSLFVPPVIYANQVTLAATSLSGDSDGAGTLATLTFEVLAVKPSSITLSDVMVMKQDLTSIPIIVKGGDVVVLSANTLDVNGDGIVNIQDLTIVATHFGTTGTNQADVNNDNVVDIRDLLLVAGGINAEAAAPLAYSQATSMLTVEDIQKWLIQAKQLNRIDAKYQEGIAVLHQLLVVLTPKETALLPNYPNPFNPETWIPYQLAKTADVKISIYAADGKLIRMLALGHQPIGTYQGKSRAAYWDGKNRLGEPVASGVYFYTLTAGDFAATRKMLIRK